MNRAFRWSMSAIMVALIATGALFFWRAQTQLNGLTDASVRTLSPVTQAVTVTAAPVSGVGAIELISQRQVVLMTSGTVAELGVEVGDTVKRGDMLIALDTKQLEWALQQADIGLENARINLEKASEAIDPSDVALAEANLLSAQEQLALVEAGPTKELLDAAKSSNAAAWATYNELRAGPSPEALTQARAALRQAEIDLQQAQRAYDRIAWQPDAGASSEGAALQRASITHEAAKARFDELTKPALTSALQGALAAAQRAQDALNELEKKPTPAELADAKARVAGAEATLAKLNKGTDAADVRAAELGVQSAQIALEQAKLNLANARLLAPVDGVVLDVAVELGEQVNAGSVVALVANVSQLRAMVNVEQKDIRNVKLGQGAAVTVYGLTDTVYNGVVDKIAPMGDISSGSIVFPVTIRFTDDSVVDLKPGMSATATFTTTVASE